MLMARPFLLVLRANRSALVLVVSLSFLLCMDHLIIDLLTSKSINSLKILILSSMNKLPFFSGKMPSGRVLFVFLKTCCDKLIPFRYDPSTKDFCAYPICKEDLDEMREFYNHVTNALSVTNSNT